LFLELAELFPGYFKDLQLNIPESNNALPDIVDEALWGLDFYRRMQTAEGGIRGGIESAGHPRYGEASWQESQDVMAYAPDMWSSYIYAGVAARAAHWLESRSPKLAAVYRRSAIQAIKYAENAYAARQGRELPPEVLNERNLAAVELFRLTGEDRWHKIFLETSVHKAPASADVLDCQQCDAAFIYTLLNNVKVNATVRKNAMQALLRAADISASLANNTAFKWTKSHPYHPINWGTSLGSPKAVTLLRAHFLTGRADYLRASILACQFSAGANPSNMTFTTGLGHRSPRNPLIVDPRVMGQSPPPGITVYGPLDPVQFSDYWTFEVLKTVTFPEPQKWPTTEAYFDIYLFPPVTEYTIMQTMGPTAYAWGYLAARRGEG
jgi:endoglucanase